MPRTQRSAPHLRRGVLQSRGPTLSRTESVGSGSAEQRCTLHRVRDTDSPDSRFNIQTAERHFFKCNDGYRFRSTHPALQDNQLMSKHHVLGFMPQLRLEWRAPERNKATRSFRQLRRFLHVINSDKVFGTHSTRPANAREGVDRVGEGDAINFVDLIGRQQNALGSRSALESGAEGKGGRRTTSRPHLSERKASRAWAIRMPMLRMIKIAVIAVSMANPWGLESKSAAHCTVKVIRRAAEVAAPLMIFGNSGRECMPAIDTREG